MNKYREIILKNTYGNYISIRYYLLLSNLLNKPVYIYQKLVSTGRTYKDNNNYKLLSKDELTDYNIKKLDNLETCIFLNKYCGEYLTYKFFKENANKKYLYDSYYKSNRFNKDLIELIKNNNDNNDFIIEKLYPGDIWKINNIHGKETVLKFKKEEWFIE